MKRKMWMLGGALFALSTAVAQKSEEPVRFKSDEEKVRWVQEHPEEYRKMTGEETGNAERPVEFRTDAEKSAYLRANGLGTETVILEDIPGYPKYNDTGNPELDQADYANRKDLWIEQHQELYIKMTRSAEENVSREERLQREEIIIRN